MSNTELPFPSQGGSAQLATHQAPRSSRGGAGAALGKRRRRRIIGLVIAATLLLVWWFVPAVYRLRSGPVTVTRYDRKLGESKARVGPDQPGWISTKVISRHVLHAIIAAEDGRFYQHHGIDFEAVKKSYAVNIKRKRYARGGSTLSQQVVKMAFLGREKTLLRKAREAVGTVLMELILSKDQILGWYINLAEFGDGVYGLKDGCWHYFKTKPELLSVEQAVHLALVLPSPNGWSRGLRQRHLTKFGHRRYAAIVNTMRNMGFITKAQWATTMMRGDFGRPVLGYEQLLSDEKDGITPCSEDGECAPSSSTGAATGATELEDEGDTPTTIDGELIDPGTTPAKDDAEDPP